MKTYKITRDQFKEIHSIACADWKTRIEKLAQDTLGSFGEQGELSQEIVQSMRDASDSKQIKVIDSIFPKPKALEIKDYADACKIVGRKPLSLTDFKFLPTKEAYQTFARHKVITGIETINEGWIADFNNPNQRKHYIYGYMENGKKVLVVVSDCNSISDVGSALLIESSEKAEIIKKLFKSEIEEYLF